MNLLVYETQVLKQEIRSSKLPTSPERWTVQRPFYDAEERSISNEDRTN